MADGHLNTIEEESEELEDVQVTTVDEERQVYQLPRIQCIVCLNYIRDGQRFIQPCKCGFWVHPRCLTTGVQMYEATHPGHASIGCMFCATPYDILPRKSLAFQMLHKVSFRYGQLCDLGCTALTVMIMDSTLTTVGMFMLIKIYGQNEATELLFSKDPVTAVALCKAIPLISIAVSSIPWEVKLLRLLRRCSHLPVVGSLFPSADSRVRDVKYRKTLFGVLGGGLLLPWHAAVLGVHLYEAVQCRLCRFLLGGVTFVALKGALQMYYRQRLYARQCFLTVESYHGDE